MANLPETSNFDAGVYEIATTDLVLGGPSGPANAGAQNLTNRTRWLFDQVNALNADVTAIDGDIATLNSQVTTINGQIAGINANLASINGQLPLLAPIANPGFTGAPTAPTPGSFVNNSQLATTAYVFNWYAPKASPALTGTPTAPTAAFGTNTTQLATTAFVAAAVSGLLGTNGVQLLQNGFLRLSNGWTIQWGLCNPNGGTITVTFPTTFLSAFFACVATSTATPTQCNVHNATTSSIQVTNTGGQSYWIAIGE